MESEAVDLSILDTPDPDPEELPAVIPQDALLEQRAIHICRAILRAEATVEKLTEQMKADQAAYAKAIMAAQQAIDNWRSGILAWMQANKVPKLTTPWWTASVRAGRSKLVIDDEAAAIATVKSLGADKAVRVKESLVRQEFDPIYQAKPKLFEGIAHEEQGDPGLTIRKKEAK